MTGHRQSLNEVQVLEHFESLPHSGHPGSKLVRRMLASFQLGGVTGPHTCIVHRPLSLSLRGIRNIAGGKIPGELLKSMVYGMLLGLDYLHSEARVVHTGK
jgi:serine/threonine-protein kinase SRPK3